MALGAAIACSQAEESFESQMLLSRQLLNESQANRAEAYRLAPLLGWKVKGVKPDGTVIELTGVDGLRPEYTATLNAASAATIRTNHVYPGGLAGYSLLGSGVLLGIWDSGLVRLTHQAFGGRAFHREVDAVMSHGTHVGGTMIGGATNPNAMGMAPGAILHSYSWGDDRAEMVAAAASGMRISNHSYGSVRGWTYDGAWYWAGDTTFSQNEDNDFGRYTDSARLFDVVAYGSPRYLIVKAAGNDRGDGPTAQPVSHWVISPSTGEWVASTRIRPLDGGTTGYDTIPTWGNAKNLMIVGAVDDVPNYTSPTSVTMSTFSGWGPCDDGRIKPDIVANGVDLFSSDMASDSNYSTKSGTSMSSPSVAGSAGVILEHWRDLGIGSDPWSSTMKAMIIHTADECGPNPGPDYVYGWGLMNTRQAVRLITLDDLIPATIRENRLLEGVSHQTLWWGDGFQNLKATMVWNDPPRSIPRLTILDDSTRAIVNDLDLKGTKGNTGYYPWKLNRLSPASAATRGVNDVDNVEQILSSSNVSGFISLKVNHKGTDLATQGYQDYSLIVTGVRPISIRQLALNVRSVKGGNGIIGTVLLQDDAPTNVSVELTSNKPDAIVPASIIIPTGSNQKSFIVSTKPVSSNTVATITAQLPGGNRASLTLTITPPTLSSIDITTDPTVGGLNTKGNVKLSSKAPVGGTVIALSSNNGNVQPPSTVTVLEGNTSVSFFAQTFTVDANETATVTALLNGVNRSDTFTISVGGLKSLLLGKISQTGGLPVNGTVVLTGIAPYNVPVALTTNHAAGSVPSPFNVGSGTDRRNFVITTQPVTTNTLVTIFAEIGNKKLSRVLTLTP